MMAAETVMTVRTRTMTVGRGKLTAQLGCRSGHRWLHLGCLKATAHESRPLCWTDTFVDRRFASIVRAQDAFRSAVFGLIEKEAGETVVEIQQGIRAVILVNGEALRIAAAPGSAALEIIRRYFSPGRRLIQVSVNTIPADRFFYSVEILRGRHRPSRSGPKRPPSALKVRPGFGAVTMKNVGKTKCAEQDCSCRPAQFKVPWSVDDSGSGKTGGAASTGSRTRRTSQRSPAALSTGSAALTTSMPMPSKFPWAFPRWDLSKGQLAFSAAGRRG
jgi:hypothetical protein